MQYIIQNTFFFFTNLLAGWKKAASLSLTMQLHLISFSVLWAAYLEYWRSIFHSNLNTIFFFLNFCLQQVVVNFSASWSGPCQTIAPLYSELSEKYPALTFLTVDVDELAVSSASWLFLFPEALFFLLLVAYILITRAHTLHAHNIFPLQLRVVIAFDF